MDTLGIIALVVGTASLVLSTAAILLFILSRFQDLRSVVGAVEVKQDFFIKRQEEYLKEATDIETSLRALQAKSSLLSPEIPAFVQLDIRFVQKMLAYRTEKLTIADRIARKHVRDNQTMLLDSGSTTDMIVSYLLSSYCKTSVKVQSNNILAAIQLAGKKAGFRLLPGDFDDQFAAVYSEEACLAAADNNFDVYVLAAVRLRRARGIMVRKDDHQNKLFKAAALRGFDNREGSQLVIAADPSKFALPTDEFEAIIAEDVWESLLKHASDRITIVTTPVPSDFADKERTQFHRETQLFEELGIRVDMSEGE